MLDGLGWSHVAGEGMVGSSLIEVVLKGGELCWLAPRALDLFLRQGRVTKFRRSDGWAVVGRHPVRGNGTWRGYTGPERRASGPACFLSQTV